MSVMRPRRLGFLPWQQEPAVSSSSHESGSSSLISIYSARRILWTILDGIEVIAGREAAPDTSGNRDGAAELTGVVIAADVPGNDVAENNGIKWWKAG